MNKFFKFFKNIRDTFSLAFELRNQYDSNYNGLNFPVIYTLMPPGNFLNKKNKPEDRY